MKKRTICSLGPLTETQQEHMKLICRTISHPSHPLTTLEDILVSDSQPYLSLAVADALWKHWRLSQAFGPNITERHLSTPLTARVLTLNRCVSPCAHYSIPAWIRNTAVSDVIGEELASLTDDKIYYELSKIDQSQEYLEQHLFHLTSHNDPASYQWVTYDLTSSYFIGTTWALRDYGKSKDHQPHRKQILLGLLVNKTGFAFKWHVYPGNTSEIDTLIANVTACQHRFQVKNVTVVFDRGLGSDDNLRAIQQAGLKYLSALDNDQIATIPGIDLAACRELSETNFNDRLLEDGFVKYDDTLYIKELGVIGFQRYILGFNPDLWREERQVRQEKMACFTTYVVQKNHELSRAKRARKADPTQRAVLDKLRNLKLRKYFRQPMLKEIEVTRSTQDGSTTTVRSFHITVPLHADNMAKSELVDGLCVFISNHHEMSDDRFLVSVKTLVRSYREKSVIEDVFKHLKSFLRLRPFYVHREEHVRAVYTICVLAYVLNKDLAERRKALEGVDYLNSKNLYAPFRNGQYVTLKDLRSGRRKKQTGELTSTQERWLDDLNIKIPQMNSILSCSP